MLHILLDSFLISLIHALIPSHWLALVAIGRSEGWSLGTTLRATLLSGLAHIGGTILLGGLVGYLGLRLSEEYTAFAHNITPFVLIMGGLFFLGTAYSHSHAGPLEGPLSKRPQSARGWSTTMAVALFFSPCLEITSYFLTAGAHGWKGITLVALVFLGVTLPTMLCLVAFGYKGMLRFKGTLLDRYGHAITAGVLIALGLASFFYE